MHAQASSKTQATSFAPHRVSLAQRFINVFPVLNLEDQRLASILYRFLAEGAPVSLGRLMEVLQRDTNEPIKALDSRPGVFLDDDGRIVGFWGLVVGETSHSLEANGMTAYAWCAWDTLFLLAQPPTPSSFRYHTMNSAFNVSIS